VLAKLDYFLRNLLYSRDCTSSRFAPALSTLVYADPSFVPERGPGGCEWSRPAGSGSGYRRGATYRRRMPTSWNPAAARNPNASWESRASRLGEGDPRRCAFMCRQASRVIPPGETVSCAADDGLLAEPDPSLSRASAASGSITRSADRNGPKSLDIRKERRIIATVNALDPIIPAVRSPWPAFFDAKRVRVVTVCVCTQPRPSLVLLC
jgi:hypothetical protein